MKKKQNELKIGLTVVIAMLVAIIGFRLMQDVPLFRPGFQLYSVFEQADGINIGSSVYMSGVKIGSVNQVDLEGPDSVVVGLNITHIYGIPVGSQARIEPSDLIGGKRVSIIHSGKDEMIPNEGYIEGHFDQGMFAELGEFTDDLKPEITRSTHSLAEVLEQIDFVLKEGGREDILQTLNALNRSARDVNLLLDRRSSDLEQSIISLQNIMANLDTLSSGRDTQLDSLLYNLEVTTRELSVVSDELGGVSSELHLMMRTINSGEGTLGKLIQDPSLYNNLDSLAVNLKNVSRIMQDDPGYFLKYMRLVDFF
ncbi:MAG: MlaD family protein [Balneolales bacterium]